MSIPVITVRRFAVFVALMLAIPATRSNAQQSSPSSLESACAAGDYHSCRSLGLLFENGTDVDWDEKRANQLYSRGIALANSACLASDATACAFLSESYTEGIGVKRDRAKAASLAQNACEHNVLHACMMAGDLYAKGGGGLAEDAAKADAVKQRAFSLVRHGCDAGDVGACMQVTRFHLAGYGTASDPGRGIGLADSLCGKGQVLGCYSAARAYQEGFGVSKSKEQAIAYYQKACTLGGSDSQACTSVRDLQKPGISFKDVLTAAVVVGAVGAAVAGDTTTASALINTLTASTAQSAAATASSNDGEVESAATAGHAAGAATGARYSGPNSREVYYLLSRVSGWTLPSCATCNDFVTPQVRMNRNSQRDLYVTAAVTAAWAAAAHAKVGKPQLAADNARVMRENLNSANALCSGRPAIAGGGSGPQTLNIWGCPPPM